LYAAGALAITPQPDRASGFTAASWRATGPRRNSDTLELRWHVQPTALFSPVLITVQTLSEGGYRGRQWVPSDVVTRDGPPAPYRTLVAREVECR
jgi:hypothetical protein